MPIETGGGLPTAPKLLWANHTENIAENQKLQASYGFLGFCLAIISSIT